MSCVSLRSRSFFFALSMSALLIASPAYALTITATTTLRVSICGNGIVDAGEQCDIPGEIGAYSTTIAGRQCSATCKWGPYCGDAILQTLNGEQCDDGNNTNGDYCSATCQIEPSGNGGGSSGGGGSASTGGGSSPRGSTVVSVDGEAYPNSTVNILIDGNSVGTVRADSQGSFLFNKTTDPGTATMGFWANDNKGTRSSTFNVTFDVTEGAVTNVNGVMLPPTIRSSQTQVNPGDTVTLSGQAPPDVTVEVSVDGQTPTLTTTSDSSGNWTVDLNTSGLSAAQHTLKAKYVEGTTLKSDSAYGTAIALAVGVAGHPISNADLNQDGKVDLTDFSILVYWWGTPGGNSNPPADINGNGKVGLEDFSILLYNWTG